jgi:hypothetical protein
MNMTRLNLPDWLRAALATSVFTFVTGVCATLVGWLNDVADWANGGASTPFPDPSVAKGALVSLGVALAVGVVNAAVRAVQERRGLGLTPDYTPADGNLGPPPVAQTMVRGNPPG